MCRSAGSLLRSSFFQYLSMRLASSLYIGSSYPSGRLIYRQRGALSGRQHPPSPQSLNRDLPIGVWSPSASFINFYHSSTAPMNLLRSLTGQVKLEESKGLPIPFHFY